MAATIVSQNKQVSDYMVAKADPAKFLDKFVKIKDENNGSTIPFKLFDYQRELLSEWQKYRLNIDLKARQLGISWLMLGFALWLLNFYDNMTILCISKTQDKAWEMIAKIKFMYQHLPAHLQKEVVRWNQGSITFKGDETEEGSRIMAVASTPGSGVGYTATLVLCDEWGEQDYAEELYMSYKPTIDMGGRLIGIGTGNNVGSFYHTMWTKARTGENGFHPHFLTWALRPGRDQAWYDATKASYPNEQEFYRQYPTTEIEAFLAAGGCPFTAETIEWYMQTHVCEPKPPTEMVNKWRWEEKFAKFAKTGELQIFVEPRTGHPYEVTFDPATGKEDGDYHAFHVLDTSNWEQVVDFESKCDTDQACELAVELARIYNQALLVWEATGAGAAATNAFTRLGYSNLYSYETIEQERAVRRRHSPTTKRVITKLGWPAGRTNNAMRDADLIAGVRDRILIIHSKRWLNQAMAFVRQADGSYAATGRANDDMVTALGMGYHVALRQRGKVDPTGHAPRTTKRRAFRRERWH